MGEANWWSIARSAIKFRQQQWIKRKTIETQRLLQRRTPAQLTQRDGLTLSYIRQSPGPKDSDDGQSMRQLASRTSLQRSLSGPIPQIALCSWSSCRFEVWAIQCRCFLASAQHVIVFTPPKLIITFTAVQLIISVATMQAVIAALAANEIVTIFTADNVINIPGEEL